MKTAIKINFNTVDEYLSALPDATRSKMQQLRETVKKAAPKAKEVISYNMPAIKGQRVLLYYAAYKNHIGFYPTASPILVFKKEISAYESSRGAIKFPLDKPIPLNLVTKIAKYRAKEDSLLAL